LLHVDLRREPTGFGLRRKVVVVRFEEKSPPVLSAFKVNRTTGVIGIEQVREAQVPVGRRPLSPDVTLEARKPDIRSHLKLPCS
jgi:hypothetical protein